MLLIAAITLALVAASSALPFPFTPFPSGNTLSRSYFTPESSLLTRRQNEEGSKNFANFDQPNIIVSPNTGRHQEPSEQGSKNFANFDQPNVIVSRDISRRQTPSEKDSKNYGNFDQPNIVVAPSINASNLIGRRVDVDKD